LPFRENGGRAGVQHSVTAHQYRRDSEIVPRKSSRRVASIHDIAFGSTNDSRETPVGDLSKLPFQAIAVHAVDTIRIRPTPRTRHSAREPIDRPY
jgi:hypothetical protein